LAWSHRPPASTKPIFFVLSTEFIDHPDDLAARQTADLAALRSLIGVRNAYVTNDSPMQGGGMGGERQPHRQSSTPSALAAYYFGDERTLDTLGVLLISGRNFTADEVSVRTENDVPHPSGYIITKQLAMKLFPAGNALGQSIFVENSSVSSPIVGITIDCRDPTPPQRVWSAPSQRTRC